MRKKKQQNHGLNMNRAQPMVAQLINERMKDANAAITLLEI